MKDDTEKYCWSWDEEAYYDSGYDSVEDCIAEALAATSDPEENEGNTLYVGKQKSPPQPETYFSDCDVERFLEKVSEQDEYGGEWTEDWDRSTREQRAELAREVQPLIAAWLDRHSLRPKFFIVDELQVFNIIDGKAERQ